MGYIPEIGDIVRINFDPGVGKEITKFRPALVLTPAQFNDQLGLAYVAPISNTVRGIGLEVQLPGALSTTGVVQTWQVRSFDWVERRAEFIEKSPAELIHAVTQKVGLTLGISKINSTITATPPSAPAETQTAPTDAALKATLRNAYLHTKKAAAIKAHPEIEPVYEFERAATHFVAANKKQFSPEISEAFVRTVREEALEVLARGETLPEKPNLSALPPSPEKEHEIDQEREL